jgi:hypothetical protein
MTLLTLNGIIKSIDMTMSQSIKYFSVPQIKKIKIVL